MVTSLTVGVAETELQRTGAVELGKKAYGGIGHGNVGPL